MIIKCIEIRDEGTCIAAIAIKMKPDDIIERTFLAREGYPRDGSGIVLMRLADQKATSDAYDWNGGSRTMTPVHLYIEDHFNELENGQVLDTRVILNEAATPVKAEIIR